MDHTRGRHIHAHRRGGDYLGGHLRDHIRRHLRNDLDGHLGDRIHRRLRRRVFRLGRSIHHAKKLCTVLPGRTGLRLDSSLPCFRCTGWRSGLCRGEIHIRELEIQPSQRVLFRQINRRRRLFLHLAALFFGQQLMGRADAGTAVKQRLVHTALGCGGSRVDAVQRNINGGALLTAADRPGVLPMTGRTAAPNRTSGRVRFIIVRLVVVVLLLIGGAVLYVVAGGEDPIMDRIDYIRRCDACNEHEAEEQGQHIEDNRTDLAEHRAEQHGKPAAQSSAALQQQAGLP